jgi:alpha-tubulin suppressor-like RCC1 family protein
MANRLALLLVLALALLAGHAWAGCTSPNAATGAINLSGTAYQYCNGTSWVAFNPTVSTTTCVSTGQMKAFPDGYIYVCDGSHWNNYATGSSKGACATASQLSFAGSHVCTCNGSQLIPWCLASESGGGGTGAAYTFGDNTFGQLGTGDANPYATVQQVTSATTIPFTGLSMGSVANSCGVDSNGKAYCWGSDIFETGALGNGAVGNVEPYPVRVVSTTAISYSTISTGINFSCALDITGKAYCWGDNSNGQLGNGSAVPSATVPVRVSNPTGSTFAQVANGPLGVCAVTADHNLWCWGLYLDLVSYTTPQQVTSATTISYKQVSTGYDHVCAVDTSGKAYCWGGSDYGTSGELGDGNSTDYAFPVRVISGTAISYTQISAGENYSCALDKNGKAYCWGDNSSGQLGNGNTTGQAVPVLVSASGVSFTSITASGLGYLGGYILTGIPGGNTTCATATTGDIYCWGYLNSAGLGSTTGLLKQLATPPSFTQVAAGNVGTCGVDGDG